jgi:hypothetical protein
VEVAVLVLPLLEHGRFVAVPSPVVVVRLLLVDPLLEGAGSVGLAVLVVIVRPFVSVALVRPLQVGPSPGIVVAVPLLVEVVKVLLVEKVELVVLYCYYCLCSLLHCCYYILFPTHYWMMIYHQSLHTGMDR